MSHVSQAKADRGIKNNGHILGPRQYRGRKVPLFLALEQIVEWAATPKKKQIDIVPLPSVEQIVEHKLDVINTELKTDSPSEQSTHAIDHGAERYQF